MPVSTDAPETTKPSDPAPAGDGWRSRRRRSLTPRYLPYLLVLPALLFELLVHVIPMLVGMYMSTLELTQFYLRRWMEAPGIGLGNFRVAIDVDGQVGDALLNSFLVTLGFAVASVALSWGLGMLGAVLLQRPFRGRSLLRTLFLVPYALPIYAGVITWKFMLERDTGMVNTLLEQTGVGSGSTFWLIGDNAFFSIVAVSVWRHWPFAFLALMAGLQSISDEVYEAAAVDGAGPWQQFRHFTLPMLRPVNLVLVLVLFLWTFNDFNVPYILFSSSVPPSADLLAIHIYNASFLTWNFGLGSAMSVLLLAFLLLVTSGYLVLNRRASHA